MKIDAAFLRWNEKYHKINVDYGCTSHNNGAINEPSLETNELSMEHLEQTLYTAVNVV